jgi:hypothetical protein
MTLRFGCYKNGNMVLATNFQKQNSGKVNNFDASSVQTVSKDINCLF